MSNLSSDLYIPGFWVQFVVAIIIKISWLCVPIARAFFDKPKLKRKHSIIHYRRISIRTQLRKLSMCVKRLPSCSNMADGQCKFFDFVTKARNN